MRIQARLALLLAVVVAIFSLTYWALSAAQAREARLLLAAVEHERNDLLDRLLALTGESLKQFAEDYSNWDDMVTFVGTGDPAWAETNLEDSLPNMNAQAAWVLQPGGAPVYGISRLKHERFETFPLAPAELVALTAADRSPHFFLASPDGLLEVRGAPILPSSDEPATTPPRGWFFIARLWDAAYLTSLGALTEGAVFLSPAARELPDRRDAEPSLNLHRDLRDWRGDPLRTLHLHYHPVLLVRLLQDNETNRYFFIAFGVAIIGLLTFAAQRWIARPLQTLSASLARRDAAPLAPLAATTSEFGVLARLVATSFADRTVLEREIEERTRAESALRTSEEELRRAMETHAHLGRDLHDGVIQSIYAAGLGLEGLRHMLRSDPVAAEARLDQVQQSLNKTIGEVRSFITGLEPEGHPRESFTQALSALATTMQSVRPVRIVLEVDDSLAPHLNPRQEVHALQVVREALSNALRHGRAAAVQISFRRERGEPVLEIRDDGTGFDPVQRAGTGNGLANLAARAREMGASFTLDSAPGKGTRITLRFGAASA